MVDHTDTRPIIDGPQRQHIAKERRKAAAELSGPLTSHVVPSNQEEHLHGFMPVSNFSKGLNHDEYGLVHRENYSQFVKALSALDRDSNGIAHFDVDGPYLHATTDEERSDLRQWESPLAGLYYSLEGPDPAAVAMAPAPALGASELCAEMAEVYAFAILRDMPFADLLKEATKLTYIDKAGTKVPLEFPAGHPKGEGTQATLGDLRDELAKLSFLNPDGAPISSEGGKGLTSHETRRREVRWEKHPDAPETFHYTVNSMFRGSAPGAKAGPHISQFLLLGTKNRSGREGPTAGNIQFGAQHVSQRMEVNKPGLDFMSDWDAWLAVQNAAKPENPAGFFSDQNQFITTPRDLATYVHYDQLYQAYFNACLIMLTNEVEPSKGFPNANKESPRGPFATFGGPHILSLMTEVATRGLKAVRRQKFQIHRRARPEVIAARLTQVQNGHDGKMPKPAKDAIESMLREFGADYVTGEKDDDKPWVLLHWIDQINADREQVNRPDWMAKGNFLLPMAFPEGSPMHPAYGAGHATVAGACVTVLKAFFEMTGPAAELTWPEYITIPTIMTA